MALWKDKPNGEAGYGVRLVPKYPYPADATVEIFEGDDSEGAEAIVLAFGIGELIQNQLGEMFRDAQDNEPALTDVELRRWGRWASLLEVYASLIRATTSGALPVGEPVPLNEVFGPKYKATLEELFSPSLKNAGKPQPTTGVGKAGKAVAKRPTRGRRS